MNNSKPNYQTIRRATVYKYEIVSPYLEHAHNNIIIDICGCVYFPVSVLSIVLIHKFVSGFTPFLCGSCCSFFSFLCSRLLIVVCHFVFFLLSIVLSVLLRFTDSDYPFSFFKLFLSSCISGLVFKFE